MRNNRGIRLPLLPRSNSYNYTQVDNENPAEVRGTGNYRSYFMDSLDPRSSPEKYNLHLPFFKKLMFLDIFPYVKMINSSPSKQLALNDIPLPTENFNIESKLIKLDSDWTNEMNNNPQPSFASALYRTFMPEIIICLALLFVDCTSKICYALL